VVRDLRKKQTKSESIIWNILRNRKINYRKFIRQYPFSYKESDRSKLFVIDFYCSELKLAIEIDGSVHNNLIERDFQRDMILKEKGINVVRFSNQEVETNIDTVINKLKMATFKSPSIE